MKWAIEVFDKWMIERDRVKPTHYEYGILITLLGRAGYLHKAFNLFYQVRVLFRFFTGDVGYIPCLRIMFMNFAQYYPHYPRSCQGERHRLRIFMLKFYVKVFRTSLFFYLIEKREVRQAILSGDRSCSLLRGGVGAGGLKIAKIMVIWLLVWLPWQQKASIDL